MIIIFLPIGLIIRLIILCVASCKEQARKRALRREQEEAERGLLSADKEGNPSGYAGVGTCAQPSFTTEVQQPPPYQGPPAYEKM